eukprot:11310968-Ditylum_brightwellii.AAC.1
MEEGLEGSRTKQNNQGNKSRTIVQMSNKAVEHKVAMDAQDNKTKQSKIRDYIWQRRQKSWESKEVEEDINTLQTQ